jgi:putative heme-binding domain-containing protein
MNFRTLLLLLLGAMPSWAEPVALFDGKTLNGWQIPAGEEKWWKVQDGAITGGSLAQDPGTNLFLATAKEYGNFELKFKVRIVKGEGFMNSGMQVRSSRLPDGKGMKGYQVDVGTGYWGDLYDEHRRDKKIAGAMDPEALKAVVKDWDWNEYRVVCDGPRMRSWINGVLTFDYTEQEKNIPLAGLIGLQVHSGGKCLVQAKDITIDVFSDTPPPPPAKRPVPSAEGASAKSPADQLASFHLPPGFVAELVASEEEGVGKPITVAWDAKGRMWTMTALEYPVDGNENMQVAEALYAKGGADKVLVFDDPSGPLPLKPRVFAEGLAIPLGLLPDLDGNGAFVHYGSEIRRYVDTNGDGKADKFDVILEGFGIQDSHLMPHQFERAPGGWIYVAQGLFNSSKVRRPGGKPFADGTTEKAFNACKLARFKPDGSEFELVTAGPNNIWGLTQTRSGETFIQEANDMGIPVTEFEPGTHYATGSAEKLKPYAPTIPESLKVGVGGTGLSGLADAGDFGSKFASYYGGDNVIFLANPITSRIQVISTRRTDKNEHPTYHLREDFLVSDDPWFRPVAVRFGPDGFLYITDWYNKIISHNEVPRNHPDRDKSRGRIWRVRPVDVKPSRPVNLTALDNAALARGITADSQLNAAMSWQLLAERKATGLKDPFANLALNPSAKLATRLDAIYTLELTGGLDANLLRKLSQDPLPEIRYQALRAAGNIKLDPAAFVVIYANTPDDPNYRVRAALANAVRHHPNATPAMISLVARLGKAPISGSEWATYDRRFERYLARWAMEVHSKQTAEMLAKFDKLPAEARLLAILSQPSASAAIALVGELSKLNRPLDKDELALFGSQISQPEVLSSLDKLLADPGKRAPLLDSLTKLDPDLLAQPALAASVTKACNAMLAGNPSPLDRSLILKLARLLRLKDLEPAIAAWLTPQTRPTEAVAILSALREMQSSRADLFATYVGHPDDSVRRSAIGALVTVDDPKVVEILAKRWDQLPGALRTIAIDGLTASKAKASAFVSAAVAGQFKGLDDSTYERLIRVLGENDPDLTKLLANAGGVMGKIVRLPGEQGSRIRTAVDLDGAFTVETWIKLDEGIDNKDGLLGLNGGPDMNFYQGRLRVFDGRGDLIIANRELKPGIWTHCAITRDDEGKLRIYLDGELDQDQGKPSKDAWKGLNLGETHTGILSGAGYSEFRVWDVARSADEIRFNYHTNIGNSQPAHLKLRVSGDQPGNLEAPAAVVVTRDFPALLTSEQAAAQAAKFEKFRAMASKPGDAAAGKALFQASCMICHQVRGEGTKLGPDLSGVGAMGLEAVLRNILDPSAQLESGYYRHDLTLTDGSFVSGFLVQETPQNVTIRPIGAEVRVIERSKIAAHDVSKRSLMPEGLLDGMEEKQVQDLFNYLLGLK